MKGDVLVKRRTYPVYAGQDGHMPSGTHGISGDCNGVAAGRQLQAFVSSVHTLVRPGNRRARYSWPPGSGHMVLRY